MIARNTVIVRDLIDRRKLIALRADIHQDPQRIIGEIRQAQGGLAINLSADIHST
jgi:hypothetical protein